MLTWHSNSLQSVSPWVPRFTLFSFSFLPISLSPNLSLSEISFSLMASVASSSTPLFSPLKPTALKNQNKITLKSSSYYPLIKPPSLSAALPLRRRRRLAGVASSAVSEEVRTGPETLVDSILSKVSQTDRGVLLAADEHKKVAEVAQELKTYCVDKPVECPLIFGEWDVVYCSNPTSPGGGYRSSLGRLIFKTKEMIQVVEAPDIVRNRVTFSLFGFLDGEVSLEGKLKVLDESWIQVIFEAPELKVGALEFRYGGQSEVKLEITYVDDKIRLGKGSRGSLFVFQRLK